MTAKPLAEEVDAKDNVDGGAVVLAITTVGAAVPGAVGVSAAAVAPEEVTPGGVLSAMTAVTVSAPPELADISAPKG